MTSSEHITIAIDGPASSGKSTVAKILAKELKIIYIDTGAMYRALTLLALETGTNLNQEIELASLLDRVQISFQNEHDYNKVYLNGREVTSHIRSNEVTQNVSKVSSYKSIRQEMVERQRDLVQNKSAVLDGRDIGTVVLPDAQVKIYLKASVEERARRRYEENKANGIETDYFQLIKDISQRDYMDQNRKESPLRQAKDAHVIDTTKLTIDQVVDTIVSIVNKNK